MRFQYGRTVDQSIREVDAAPRIRGEHLQLQLRKEKTLATRLGNEQSTKKPARPRWLAPSRKCKRHHRIMPDDLLVLRDSNQHLRASARIVSMQPIPAARK